MFFLFAKYNVCDAYFYWLLPRNSTWKTNKVVVFFNGVQPYDTQTLKYNKSSILYPLRSDLGHFNDGDRQ